MATFKEYNWFESPKSNRLFVIARIWWNEPGAIASIELLEKGERKPVVLAETELASLVKCGELAEVLPKELPNPYK